MDVLFANPSYAFRALNGGTKTLETKRYQSCLINTFNLNEMGFLKIPSIILLTLIGVTNQ